MERLAVASWSKFQTTAVIGTRKLPRRTTVGMRLVFPVSAVTTIEATQSTSPVKKKLSQGQCRWAGPVTSVRGALARDEISKLYLLRLRLQKHHAHLSAGVPAPAAVASAYRWRGVIGISSMLMPSGASASSTALAMAAGAV